MKMIYSIINNIELIGRKTIQVIENLGNACIFVKNIILNKSTTKKQSEQFIKNIYFIGVLSLGIIILSALFIGMVVGLQGHYILKKFGVENVIGQMTALTIIRELGPVVSALLFTGRTGASLTAEICSMKSTDQLLSMKMMGIDPMRKIIIPRFWSGIISMIILSLIFMVVAIIGSYISSVYWLNIDNDIFWISIKENVDFKLDILNSLIKSTIFGFMIIWISIYQGVSSNSTAEGIARSTTNSVVYSTFTILGLNFFLTAIMF